MLSKTKRFFTPFCFLAAAFGVFNIAPQGSRSILTRNAPPADQRVVYGKAESQFGELRLPKGPGPHPVAIVIHGGCWLSQYNLAYMGHVSAALTEAGIATWSIEYRRIGQDGGGWPGTFEDVARAADHLRELAKTHPLDLTRVVATGHSAGGHLALWLAARKYLSRENPLFSGDPLPLAGVVALAPITDLRKNGTACDREVLQLMGGSAKERAATYNLASPVELLPLKIPHAIVQGDADPIIPMAMATEYVEAAKKKGDDVTLIAIEKAGHFEVVDPKSFAWARIQEEIQSMLKKK
jgi:acetyl esterase/lipase